MQVKVIQTYRDIVAICDSELLGKRFEQGKFQIDVKESFFKGEEMNKAQTIELIKDMAMEDATFNIVGKKSVECAIEAGLVSKDSVKVIQGIPFVLILL